MKTAAVCTIQQQHMDHSLYLYGVLVRVHCAAVVPTMLHMCLIAQGSGVQLRRCDIRTPSKAWSRCASSAPTIARLLRHTVDRRSLVCVYSSSFDGSRSSLTIIMKIYT